MKGMFEEYGTFVATVIIAMCLISFLITSSMRPDGAIHQFIVGNMANYGAETQTVIEEWDVGTVKISLKDDGGLYISGSGTLPSYSAVEETPWAEQSGNIIFVHIDNNVTVSGAVPYK